MKIFWLVLLILVVAFAIYALVMYLVQRARQKSADREGVVVFATIVAIEDLKGLAGKAQMKRFVLSVQEPGRTTSREVELRSRLQPGQKIQRGQRLPVVLDPKNPKRVYPATEESAKRIQVTGSRLERRGMQSQMRSPRRVQRPQSGYQPPASKLR